MIKLGKKGRIVKGDAQGWYVMIQDDAVNTGGYLVLTAKAADFQDGFDDWVEDWDTLQRYFQEAAWEVAWLE